LLKGSLFRTTLEYIANKITFPFNILFSNFWLLGPLFKHLLLRASSGAAASIRTTTAVTKIYGGKKMNALPSEVKAYINHRVHPNDTFESILEYDK
jgi:carboxypeptidase PM20D1